MRKPYENKVAYYDPGRFRFKVTFFQKIAVPDGSGGFTQSLTEVLQTFAVREEISRRESYFGAIQTPDGQTIMQDDYNFIIRNRASFKPAKDMVMVCDGFTYIINQVKELNIPVDYIKMLCLRRDVSITT